MIRAAASRRALTSVRLFTTSRVLLNAKPPIIDPITPVNAFKPSTIQPVKPAPPVKPVETVTPPTKSGIPPVTASPVIPPVKAVVIKTVVPTVKPVIPVEPLVKAPVVNVEPIAELPKSKKNKKKFSLFGFLFKTTLYASVLYGALLFAATKNDKVMDFVIDNQLPYYEELLDVIEHGTIEDVKDTISDIQDRIANIKLPSKTQVDELTSKFEKAGGDLIKDTKQKYASSPLGTSPHDLTPAQQLQKPVGIEVVKDKDIVRLPLIEIGHNVDASVKSTVNSFNQLIKSIDAADVGGSPQLIKSIEEAISGLNTRLDGLTVKFNEEVQSKVKVSQTELLSLYTKKELELTENFLNQFKSEKAHLENKLNQKLIQEIESTKDALSQAAANAVSMVRVQQTKNYEQLIVDKINKERDGRLANLDQLNGRLGELETFATSLEKQLSANHEKQLIHQYIVRLRSALLRSDPSSRVQSVQPFVDDLVKVATSNNELISLALQDLQPLIAKESTHSLLTNSQLLSRWEQLVPELRSASLLPPNAGLLGHLTSILFSKLLIPVKGAKPDGKDVESVIARVESSLVRGDLDVAVEEATNLKGWSRKLADDWVVQGRKRLEIETLLNVIESESRIL